MNKDSPIVETDKIDITDDENIEKDTVLEVDGRGYSTYTYLLALIVICLVIFMLYHAYSCFCENQDIEPYINEQPRTDPQSDKAFDVDQEVKKLLQLQEQYLEQLQRTRLGN